VKTEQGVEETVYRFHCSCSADQEKVKEVEIDEENRRVKRLMPLRLKKSLRRQG
jgi:hypothetical protein